MSLAGLALATLALAPLQEPVTEPLVLRGARVLAPEGDRWLEGLAVRVEGDRITAVAPAAEVPSEGARVLALDGRWLVPGLIDLHTHLVLYPYDQRSWEEQVLKESLELRTVRAMFRRALDAGVTIACGSDAGVFAHGDNARELELLVDYGMAAPAALRAATTVAAAVLQRPEELGRIAPGALADLVVLSADPLASPSAMRAVEQVVKNGALVERD